MKTRIIAINQEKGSEEAAARAAGEVLKSGGIAAFPTDTVYGLGAVYSDREAIRKIFEAKGRPENKPLSILVADRGQVDLLAEDVSEEAKKLMKQFWPGALTLIFRKKMSADIPEEVTAGGDTIGVRMPDCDLTIRIIEQANAPLAAPSANLSGKRSAACGKDVIEDLFGRVDLIIDNGECPVGVSSTVIDMSGQKMRILREGTVTADMIEEITGIRPDQ